jgi:D-glycero-D-manno-heptose 1,7-bisphosphate phosphatase
MKLLILDRDGTINEDRDDYVKSVDEWLPLPGALEAMARLNQAGWTLVVATNQSGLGRGLFNATALNAMHAKMHKLLAAVGGKVDAVFYCPHKPEDQCDCRKPLPGLFTQILARYGLDVAEDTVHAAGDTLRDAQAGAAAGCIAHLLLTGKSESMRGRLPKQQAPANFPDDTRVHDDLASLAEHLITTYS